MSERERVYIGGPLNNQPVAPVGGYWSHFRDDDGQPISDEVGMPATRERRRSGREVWPV